MQSSASQAQNSQLSNEQRDRMLRNRQIAEEKRQARIREKERLQVELLSTQDLALDSSTNLKAAESGNVSVQDRCLDSQIREGEREKLVAEEKESLSNEEFDH